MRIRGPRENTRRRAKSLEYALVLLTVVVIIVLAGWFLGREITDALDPLGA